MKPLRLPEANLRLKQDEEGEIRVFDPLRKLWVILTPEEYVRQHFTSWMIHNLGYPPALMANEIGINVNGTSKRCDTVAFDRDGKPLIIVEYKAPDVHITQDVFDQIVRYNMRLRARYLVVSNGINHYCCKIDYERGGYAFVPEVPRFTDLVAPRFEN